VAVLRKIEALPASQRPEQLNPELLPFLDTLATLISEQILQSPVVVSPEELGAACASAEVDSQPAKGAVDG